MSICEGSIWTESMDVWMLFGAELMSLSEYPQLLLVHIHARAAAAGRCGDPWFIAKISGRKRERERRSKLEG